MTSERDAVVVFTGESVDKIIEEGMTSAWRLDPTNARKCQFIVCTRKVNSNWPEDNSRWPKPFEADSSAFLVGKIDGVVRSPQHPNRFEIRFSEYARIDVQGAWKGWRNPVTYSSVQVLGIATSSLSWEKVRDRHGNFPMATMPGAPLHAVNMTIPEAKIALARTFGVTPEQIEITIKG